MFTHNEILGYAIVVLGTFCFLLWRWFLKPETPKDPWDGSDGFHVVKIRDYLDFIAEKISAQRANNYEIFSRFNAQMRCAELYSVEEGLLARVFAYTEDYDNVIKGIVVFTFLSEAERKPFEVIEKSLKVVIDFLPLQQEM